MRMYQVLLVPTGIVIGIILMLIITDVSSNVKTVVVEKPKYGKINENNRIVCDDRGYAYYEYYPNDSSNKYSLTPIFDNGIGNIQQVKCK